jgi:hypothetical protein
MRTSGTRRTAEDAEDLAAWVRELSGCPPITQTAFARCKHPSHGEDAANWFYVEADAAAGVARLRCLAGGHQTDILDSAQRWTYPGAWSCVSCSQAIAEVVYGIHDDAGTARWLVVAVRCVECGDVDGLTDFILDEARLDSLLATL